MQSFTLRLRYVLALHQLRNFINISGNVNFTTTTTTTIKLLQLNSIEI